MKKTYGTVQYNGKMYLLLEDAYADSFGPSMRPVYCARAIREGEQPDSFGYVPVFLVYWDVLSKYIAFDDDLLCWFETIHDDVPEEDLCDWSCPSSVRYDGELFVRGEEVKDYAER